jgi:hypothetical protein
MAILFTTAEDRKSQIEGFQYKKLKRMFEHTRREVAGWRTLHTENKQNGEH